MKRFVLGLVLAMICTQVAAEKRIALLIGNDAYTQVPALRKARADATAMADALASAGFETVIALDVGRRDFNLAIAKFTNQLGPGDTAFVFFAGHGVEIDGENYLLPVDILVPGEASTDFVTAESIALSNLLDRVRATGAKATLAVIDACRNNPFPRRNGRSLGRTRGLGRIAAPEGTFVVFSAGAGQLALDELTNDDQAENSVFTRLLLPKIATPGLELRALIADLRVEVRDLARTQNHAQFPAYYDELLGDFFFIDAASRSADTTPLAVLPLPNDLPELADMGAVATTKSVTEAAIAVEAAVQSLGGVVYATIDHQANAAAIGQDMPEALAVLIGDPQLDVAAMQGNRLSGLLLPLQILIFSHQGQTIIAYEHPEEVFDDLDLGGQAAVLDQMPALLFTATQMAAQ